MTAINVNGSALKVLGMPDLASLTMTSAYGLGPARQKSYLCTADVEDVDPASSSCSHDVVPAAVPCGTWLVELLHRQPIEVAYLPPACTLTCFRQHGWHVGRRLPNPICPRRKLSVVQAWYAMSSLVTNNNRQQTRGRW